MCAITVTKAKRAARDQGRKKRGLGQEASLADLTAGEGPGWDVGDDSPSGALDVELADEIEALLKKLGDEECQVLEMKMNQLDNDQIAERLGCSERTVRRLVKNIQERWQKTIDELMA
jgi:RNA polymerase sigma-70 factor, ECF subfamily